MTELNLDVIRDNAWENKALLNMNLDQIYQYVEGEMPTGYTESQYESAINAVLTVKQLREYDRFYDDFNTASRWEVSASYDSRVLDVVWVNANSKAVAENLALKKLEKLGFTNIKIDASAEV